MDAFEELIAEIFWKEGFWVQKSFKVDLTKEQKKQLDNPSMPRPEIDVLAYSGRDNVLRVIECKSYLDSRGVNFVSFGGQKPDAGKRYKLFANASLREVVFECLRQQLSARGACRKDVEIKLCLACGKIASNQDRNQLRAHFEEQKWELFDEVWIRSKLQAMATTGYENQVATLVAKLLVREPRNAAI
jgi:hypothetical protein